MLIELRLAMLAVIIVFLFFFINMLRKRKLDLKYCLVWVFALLGITMFCIFPQLLSTLSRLLGIATPSNALFLVCIAFLAFICVSLTVAVSRLSDRLRRLTQNIAIKEFEHSSKGTGGVAAASDSSTDAENREPQGDKQGR